jgi:coenzyme PQQ biosynthesis probable peptidase PqqF
MSGVQEAQLRLENGLMLRMRHEAQATEAAALLQVAAGSDAEPPAWPGLAHLLEHVLFTGSQAYQRQQRLLAWIPAQGGRLNATTRGDRTAFFFALDPAKLEPGLARLTDMLAAPLFDLVALEQEINVIEAENRLLMTDPDALCDAAQMYLFDGVPALRRFQVGNRAVFGADLPSLRQALQDFHQGYYQAGHMTLWLHGPQPLAELRALADRYCACLPATRAVIPTAALQLTARGDAMLRVAGGPRLRLSFALNGWQECDAGWFAVLRTLLNDEADGSLMAWLREREWCDGARLINSWRGTDAAIVAVEFILAQADPILGVQVERGFLYWLKQLSALSEQQLQHYVRLAQRRFNSQTALDQLRDLAFDVPALPGIDTIPARGGESFMDNGSGEGSAGAQPGFRPAACPVYSAIRGTRSGADTLFSYRPLIDPDAALTLDTARFTNRSAGRVRHIAAHSSGGESGADALSGARQWFYRASRAYPASGAAGDGGESGSWRSRTAH